MSHTVSAAGSLWLVAEPAAVSVYFSSVSIGASSSHSEPAVSRSAVTGVQLAPVAGANLSPVGVNSTRTCSEPSMVTYVTNEWMIV